METKERLFQLFLMTYGNFEIGALFSLIGTTLPDLRCLFDTDLNEMSSLFLSVGLATGCSCFLSPMLVKKCNIYLLMAAVTVLFCGAVAITALSPFIQVALVSLLLAGFSIGIVFNGTLFMCSMLFPENAYAFHVLGSGSSAGSFLSQLIAKPFLGKTADYDPSFQPNVLSMNSSIKDVLGRTWVVVLNDTGDSSSMSNNISTNIPSYCETSSSKVDFFYVTMGLTALPLALGFLKCFLKGDSDVICALNPNNSYTQIKGNKSKYEFVFIGLLIVSFTLSFGQGLSYGSYLTTIGVESSLNMGIQRAVVLTCVYWLSFLLGRLTSTAMSFCTRQMVILYVCFIGQTLASSILVIAGDSEVFLWIGSILLAFFSGPVFAAFLAWGREHTTPSPCVLGLLLFANFVGATFLPFASGQLIGLYGEKALYFYSLGLALFQLMVFFGLHGVGTIMKSDVLKKDMSETENYSDEKNYTEENGNVEH